MATLHVYMNGYLVGDLIRSSTGAHQFTYNSHWLETSGARPISLSMPLRHQEYRGDEVYNFLIISYRTILRYGIELLVVIKRIQINLSIYYLRLAR